LSSPRPQGADIAYREDLTVADRKVAFVTGASRGIGKCIAIALAEGGFDVAIAARTVTPGEAREHSPTVGTSDTTPLPGSLQETAALIEERGQRVLLTPADILDRATLGAAATTVLERWGHVDVVVHNARVVGPGHMDTFLDAPIDLIENHMEGNFYAPLVLNKFFLPAMLARGSGRIFVITSGAGYSDPLVPAGQGGWGISYGSTKAAIARVAGILAAELKGTGVQTFNIDPGFTQTERMTISMAKFGFHEQGEPPEVVGAVVRWLANADDADQFNGQTVFAHHFAAERGLVPGYLGPGKPPVQYQEDLTPARAAALRA
jgi:NAD(P)-dependent dehydrogenase (short-subunit alcohol dehydrogenase family)